MQAERARPAAPLFTASVAHPASRYFRTAPSPGLADGRPKRDVGAKAHQADCVCKRRQVWREPADQERQRQQEPDDGVGPSQDEVRQARGVGVCLGIWMTVNRSAATAATPAHASHDTPMEAAMVITSSRCPHGVGRDTSGGFRRVRAGEAVDAAHDRGHDRRHVQGGLPRRPASRAPPAPPRPQRRTGRAATRSRSQG